MHEDSMIPKRIRAWAQHRPHSPSRWAIRRHKACYFCKHVTSAHAEFGGGNSQYLAKSSPCAGPSAGAEVARLGKWRVWCLLGECSVGCNCVHEFTQVLTNERRGNCGVMSFG